MNKLTMMGIFSLGFASCLVNKYCSMPGFANPGNLNMKISAVSLWPSSHTLQFSPRDRNPLHATVLTM